MRAGLLRETITFEELRETKTVSGFMKKEYTPALTVKANRKKLSAIVGDAINASEEFIGKTLIFQVRFHPAIKDNQRVSYLGRKYNIELLDKQMQDNTYLVTCRKINE